MNLKTAAATAAQEEVKTAAAHEARRLQRRTAEDENHVRIVKAAITNRIRDLTTTIGLEQFPLSELHFGFILLSRNERYVSIRFKFKLEDYQFRGYARGSWISGEEIVENQVTVSFRSIYDNDLTSISSAKELHKSLTRYDRWSKWPDIIRWLGRHL